MRLIVCDVEEFSEDGDELLLNSLFSPWPPGSTGGQWKVIAADCMVTPLARSAGKKSVTVEPSSTSIYLISKGNTGRTKYPCLGDRTSFFFVSCDSTRQMKRFVVSYN